MKKFAKLFWALVASTCLGSAIANGHHRHELANDVDAFHGVLAPIWHARPGPERLQNACAKVDEMARLARDIRSTDASRLNTSIAAMKRVCESKSGDVDGAFYDVHEAFHHLIDAKPASVKR